VGYYEGRKLMFASKVRAGLTSHVRAELFPALKSIVQAQCPFANLAKQQDRPLGRAHHSQRHGGVAVGEAEDRRGGVFVEWTRDGLLRHPEFVAVRMDMPRASAAHVGARIEASARGRDGASRSRQQALEPESQLPLRMRDDLAD
jgi:hypothetical protein